MGLEIGLSQDHLESKRHRLIEIIYTHTTVNYDFTAVINSGQVQSIKHIKNSESDIEYPPPEETGPQLKFCRGCGKEWLPTVFLGHISRTDCKLVYSTEFE